MKNGSMPIGSGKDVTATDIANLQAWITAGTPNN
jgi:hypothetical protein